MGKKNKSRKTVVEDGRLENPVLGLLGLISSISSVDTEEIDRLVKIVKNPKTSPSARESAREKLILTNIRLVINIAKQYLHTGVPLMDLISEGTIGLMIAIEKFNPRKGFKLSTYATWWIRQRILRFIVNNQSLIRVPEHVIEKLNRLRRAADEFMDKHNRMPSEDELEEMVSLSKRDIRRYSSAVPSILSLEHSGGMEDEDGRTSLHEKVGARDDVIGSLLDRMTIQQMFCLLDERERMVMARRYGLVISQDCELIGESQPYTLDEVALELNLSRERVRQIEKTAIRKIRKHFLRIR